LSQYEPLIGAVVVILFAVSVLLLSGKQAGKKASLIFRTLPGVNKLKRAVGLAVEDGTRLHVSLGSGSLIDPACPSGLTGLATLDRIGQLTSTSDLPPMSTSGSGGFQILSQDVIGQNAVVTNTRDRMDATLAQLAGVTSFSYAAGTIEALRESGTSANVFLGSFGAEAGLLCESAERLNSFTLAGSNSVIGQSVFLALTKDALISEELYVLPAYLGAKVAHQASLRVQDIFRLVIILILIAGAVFKVMNWI